MPPEPHDPSDSIRRHYEVERELAARLRNSTRAERPALFATLYSELFARVPDHPRLTRREAPDYVRRKVQSQLRLLRPFLKPDTVFLEFAPGDCRLASAVAPHVRRSIGADISDQRTPGEAPPANLEMIVYDGYELPVPDATADVIFSYQFLEHLHPDDVDGHFKMVRRLLKPGGVYVFDSPHRYSGPHDVSRYFGDELVCFHFQEWTCRGMRRLLKRHGFTRIRAFRFGKPLNSHLLNLANDLLEFVAGLLPFRIRRALTSRLFSSVAMVAQR
jgi:SAM-dependent methyltransferase